jgi:hypothetical protein
MRVGLRGERGSKQWLGDRVAVLDSRRAMQGAEDRRAPRQPICHHPQSCSRSRRAVIPLLTLSGKPPTAVQPTRLYFCSWLYRPVPGLRKSGMPAEEKEQTPRSAGWQQRLPGMHRAWAGLPPR